MSELDKVIDQIESHAALAREQKLRAEIERLRTALNGRIEVATNLQMECDRLRREEVMLDVEKAMLAFHQKNEQVKNAEIKRLRAVIVRAKDALLDGQSTQWVHDILAQALTG